MHDRVNAATARPLAILVAMSLAVVSCHEFDDWTEASPSGVPRPGASVAHAPVPSAGQTSPTASTVPSVAAASESQPPLAASVLPPAPVGGNWLRCYAHFQPRTEPELDAQRLGLMCGPGNGLRKQASAQSRVREGGGGREHRWEAEAGDCFRIFAVAEPSVTDLDLEVLDVRRRRIAFDTTDDRWPIVKPDGPFCVVDPGTYRAVVRAQRGSGRYAIEIWRLRP